MERSGDTPRPDERHVSSPHHAPEATAEAEDGEARLLNQQESQRVYLTALRQVAPGEVVEWDPFLYAPRAPFVVDRTAKNAERWNKARHAPGSDD